MTRFRSNYGPLYDDATIEVLLGFFCADPQDSDSQVMRHVALLVNNLILLRFSEMMPRLAAFTGSFTNIMANAQHWAEDVSFQAAVARLLGVFAADSDLGDALVDAGVYRALSVCLARFAGRMEELLDEHEDHNHLRQATSWWFRLAVNLSTSETRTPMDEALNEEEFAAVSQLVCRVLAANIDVEETIVAKATEAAAAFDAWKAEQPDDASSAAGTAPKPWDGVDPNELPIVLFEFRKEGPSNPRNMLIVELKAAAASTLIYGPISLVKSVSRSVQALYGLTEVVMFESGDPVRGRALTPPLLAMKRCVDESILSAAIFKRQIFGEIAFEGYRRAKASSGSQDTMKPQASADDENPHSFKSLFLELMRSHSIHLKTCSEEIIWQLCQEDSNEYIRLVGFGRGAGLLANRGLPGFAHLAQNAIDVDAMVEARARQQRDAAPDAAAETETEPEPSVDESDEMD